MRTTACDIAVIGGGLGGVAAALAAADAGRRVVLSEATAWIGGQVTSQAVSALDEHGLIETFGGTRAYYAFRAAVRETYRRRYPLARFARPALLADPALNPGNGWVSGLCFEPRVGLDVLEGMLAEHLAAGRVTLLLEHAPVAVEMRYGGTSGADRIYAVTLAGPGGAQVAVRAELFLDATEMGDLLPLAGAPYACGAEAIEDTGEPHASRDGPHPEQVQGFTHGFLVEYCPGETHTIRKPHGYEHLRDTQPFSLVLRGRGGRLRRFAMFGGELPFWTYRRLFDASQLAPGAYADLAPRGGLAQGARSRPTRDIALINWDSNDYYKESLIDRSPAQQERVLREAARLSLSFLYWLQTEAPNDDPGGPPGYPGLRLLPSAAGTSSGLAMAPYIRESRRLLGFRRVLEQDIAPMEPGGAARAAHFSDTVGIGWYPLDLHRCAGDPPGAVEEGRELPPALPFQIPLGALLSPAVDNLVAAAKNLATTHLTGGAYRVHPVEWAVGEAAGALAAFCLECHLRPRAVWEAPEQLRAFQSRLLARGVPLVWTADVLLRDPDFAALQACLLPAGLPEGSPRRERLEILPDALLSRAEICELLERLPCAENEGLRLLLALWKDAPLGPLSGADWSAACAALGLPAPEHGGYPTMRQVCRGIAALS